MADATQVDLDLLSNEELDEVMDLVWADRTKSGPVEVNGKTYRRSQLIAEWTQRLDQDALAESVYE